MKLKNKYGFTLVELLAVIVVLAIIALIATPIVMNTIKSAKKGSAERSADNYIKQVETAVATERLEGNILEGEYIIQSDGNLCPLSGCGEDDKDKVIIAMEGNKPTSGTIKISNDQVTTDSTMTIGEYDVSYDETTNKYVAIKLETYSITYNLTNVSGDNSNGSSITTKGVKTLKFTANSGYSLPESVIVTGATSVWDKTTGTLTLSKATIDVTITVVGEKLPYVNGEVVYFNVTTGEKCSNYAETQSKTGVKEGCMKFYAFNDDGKDTVNLILDHNTTAKVAWNKTYKNDSGSITNAKGPKEVLDQLKTDTSSWKGTITPSNYTMDQTGQTSNAKYTIDYSSYKARLITAQEIAKITGNTSWNEVTGTSNFYFDTNTSSQSATCKSGNTTGCGYGWLYDRTNKECTKYGCLNNADSSMFGYGYWTASSFAGHSDFAWSVLYAARVDSSTAHLSNHGVRPVITISKSQLG